MQEAAAILSAAERPLIIAGRGDAANFAPLGRLAERIASPVVQFWSNRLSLATTHPMHAGFDVTPFIGEADALLVLDAPVPWLPVRHVLKDGCKVIQLAPDPTFQRLPMRWLSADMKPLLPYKKPFWHLNLPGAMRWYRPRQDRARPWHSA